jgi:hypothetical protein
MAEQLFRTAQYSRTKEETLQLSDKLQNFFSTIVSDPLILSEIYFYSLGIDLADSISIDDTISRVATLNRTVCETSAIHDVTQRIVDYLRQVEDEENIEDLVRLGKFLLAFISDTLGISDQVAYNLLRYIMARYFQGDQGYFRETSGYIQGTSRYGERTSPFKGNKKYPYYTPRDYEKDE